MRYAVAGYDPTRGLSWVRDTTKPHGQDFVCWAESGQEAQRIANNMNDLAGEYTKDAAGRVGT